MKKIKTVALMALATTSLIALGSCNQAKDTTKIGLVMYSWSDVQGTTIQNYCKYLEKNMDVEFVYEATNYQDDLQVSCVENLISAGCEAIISGYDTSIVSALDTCTQAGVYYTLALDYASESDFGTNTPSEYFLGGTQQFGGDLTELGKAYAAAANANGLSSVGGVSFPAWAFTEGPTIYSAFKTELQRLNQSATVDDLTLATGFMQTDIETATNNALTNNANMDGIFGLSSGIDYVYPVIRDKSVKLISMGYDSSVQSLMENGKLVVCGNNNHVQSIASCVARILNAVEGNSYSDSASGTYNQGTIVNGVAGYPIMASLSDVADYKAYVDPEDMANGSVSVEELKNCIISYNKDAKLSDLNKLTNRTLSEIKAARN